MPARPYPRRSRRPCLRSLSSRELLTCGGHMSTMIYSSVSIIVYSPAGGKERSMALERRIEAAMDRAIAIAIGRGRAAPPKLASALDYAVTPGGARIRPTILLSVATACGDDRPEIADA